MKHLSNFDAFLQKIYRHMDVKTRNGVVQTLIAAFLWGASGTLVQFLFQHREIEVEWLITMRTLISGMALLALALLTKKISSQFGQIKKIPCSLSYLVL